ncbi:MAG: YitT family protein [Lachnospiraceae bacterium]|nr:YitT family protein [Lachnospiraceae bacterium]
MLQKEKHGKKLFLDFLLLAAGAIIAAFAIEEFLVPNTILDGGVVGVSIMINTLSGFPLGVLTIVLNIPFLIVSARRLGRLFIIKAVYAMAIFSIFLEIFEPLVNATEELLLAVCFGGVILGFGVGLVIRFGGCLDGTECVAILINRKFKFPTGQTVLIINVAIYVIAGFLFGFDRAMCSLLTYFITSRIIDWVDTGLNQAKAAMIITDKGEEISKLIYQRLGRTVTILEGEGLISGKKVVLYCVLTRMEIYELKRVIREVDASAFVTISDVSEIIGNHIKKVEPGAIPGED